MSGHKALGGQHTRPGKKPAQHRFGVRSDSSRLPATAQSKIVLSP
jgi:hypothetical protein